MSEEYISIWKCPKCGAMHRECRYYEYALAVEIPPRESDGTCSFFCPFLRIDTAGKICSEGHSIGGEAGAMPGPGCPRWTGNYAGLPSAERRKIMTEIQNAKPRKLQIEEKMRVLDDMIEKLNSTIGDLEARLIQVMRAPENPAIEVPDLNIPEVQAPLAGELEARIVMLTVARMKLTSLLDRLEI